MPLQLLQSSLVTAALSVSPKPVFQILFVTRILRKKIPDRKPLPDSQNPTHLATYLIASKIKGGVIHTDTPSVFTR